MNFPREKLVRFQEWKKMDSSSSWDTTPEMSPGGLRTKFQKQILSSSEGLRRIGRSFKFPSSSSAANNETKSKRTILDPQGPFLQKWNKIFVISCVIAVSLDPLFFYVPVIDDVKKCLSIDKKIRTTACVLRSFTDIFYILHILFQFHTGFIEPYSRVFGRGVLVQDSWLIAKRYLSSYFLLDIIAVLPLPQIAILATETSRYESLRTKDLLKFIVLFQYIPRVARIYPLYNEVTRTSGILTETAWAGAAFNLLLYMLASHVLGAFWYLYSIERETTCWKEKGNDVILDCKRSKNNAFLEGLCPVKQANATLFDYGMFLDALQSGIVSTANFPQKFLYCFWWGLRNLSSLGQNLTTSTYVWEICFAVFISISGLVLFALLIGNMQTYLQATTTRLEEMRIKRRDAEQWMSHRLLPKELRERVRRYEHYKWQETRGVDEENLVHNLPKDLRRDIKRHLCLALLMKVPMFEKMDEQLLDALCDRLKPALYTEESYIVREGDPVDEMVFIMRGTLLTETTNGGRTGFFNSDTLQAGQFCGEELLTWALDPHSSSNLPISTRTVRSITEVEAFALQAEDLKFVASQFRRLHSKQLRHTFRFYSLQWRTWAACFIQVAWRRYRKKNMEENLRMEESRLQVALVNSAGSSPSFGATIYASRFAANALRALRRNGTRKNAIPERVSPILLQKPAEPDFNVDEE